MKRADLEHILRAAGAITKVPVWVVLGIPAILASAPDAPREVCGSNEAELYAPDRRSAGALVDGSIGQDSPFHRAFGYCARGVDAKSAALPRHWGKRAMTIQSQSSGGVAGICPAPADLAISRLAVWDDQDRRFVRALLRHGLVGCDELRERLRELPAAIARKIESRLRAIADQASR